MNRKQLPFIYILLGVFLAVCSNAFGQSTGSLQGTIRDSLEAIVSDATVTLTPIGGGKSRVAKSNENGFYRFLSLTPGRYHMKVEAQGFATSYCYNVDINASQIATIDKALRLGGDFEQ